MPNTITIAAGGTYIQGNQYQGGKGGGGPNRRNRCNICHKNGHHKDKCPGYAEWLRAKIAKTEASAAEFAAKLEEAVAASAAAAKDAAKTGGGEAGGSAGHGEQGGQGGQGGRVVPVLVGGPGEGDVGMKGT
ncbi:hypothetical protein LTR12_009046 [Friedmanniomyces endolithicus]|nr:hypothetical protein LTR74_010896 [Friedmanniomyces endolithicus]KAK1816567.1 hypothetical protein LTR12_009046 [Friedmanniomyces endolithicus]